MARRTLEAITVEKGETSGTLSDRLKVLATSHVLLPDLAEWAKEVRLIGNTGAHYDPLDKATMEDARDLLNFIQALMGYFYELPATLARRRNKT
ncbi:MAG: hypothetical protein JWN14_1572 [Chthonomonadales bacterium]|nr:hypothetical protein [Chthonomonadales bacterium]